ncbi:MAG: tetratricopeptide repeat protein [Acidobacteria bacterium]|nr:tetratricopeptide repeat protein [Acidobacteriota bacterium]
MIPVRRWLPGAVLVALVGGYGIVCLQKCIDDALADRGTEQQLLYLSSPQWVKRLAMGYDGLLACIYWTRAVQHFGRERLGTQGYTLLYPLLDITTTLDPEFIWAYRFGSIFLTEEPPRGPGQPEKAIALLQKGLQQHPDDWRLWYDLGFVYYRSLKDYSRAAEAFYSGADKPGAGPWMRVMAAQIAAEGGSRRWARFLWTELYNSTKDRMVRDNALDHLAGLQVDDDIEILHTLLERYRKQTGKPAQSFQELVAAGLLRRLPADPVGYPYRLGPQGRVRLDPQSPITTSTLGREK